MRSSPTTDFPPLRPAETLNSSNALNIPVEVWDDIIAMLDPDRERHLESLSLVCTYLYDITSPLKQTLTISDPTADLLPSILCRFPNLKHLSLSYFTGDPVPVLSRLADFDFRLESLDLSNQCRFPVEALRLLPPSILAAVKSLNLGWIPSLGDDDLQMIPNLFPKLEDLDLSLPSNRYIYDDDDDDGDDPRRHHRWNSWQVIKRNVTGRGILMMASKLRGTLRRINLEGNDRISAMAIIIAWICPNLEEIAVDEPLDVQIGIASALNCCKHLKKIALRGTVCGRPMEVNAVHQQLCCTSSLSRIDFRHTKVSNALLSAISKSCLPLESFTLSHCHRSTDDGSPTLAFSYSGIRRFLNTYRSLHYLALEHVEFLSDAKMATLAKFLRKIRVLKLNRCQQLTDSTFYTLIKECPFLQTLEMKHTSIGLGVQEYRISCRIKTLNLSSNWEMTDDSLWRIALACRDIETLHLRSCLKISRKGVGQVMKNCRDLKQLHIDGCEGVKNLGMEGSDTKRLEFLGAARSGLNYKALIDISKKCPDLMFLNVKNCKALTPKGVAEVVERCTKLKEINLHGCPIGSHSLHRIVFCNPNRRKLKIVHPARCVDSNEEENLYRKHGCYVTTQFY